MGKNRQRKYFRLTRAERSSIERAMDKRSSARSIARDLGRSPSSITDEIKRNRTVCKGPGKGERVIDVPEGQVICPRLTSWPWVCNGCRLRRYHCSRTWRCEYSAMRAQAIADKELTDARRGVNRSEVAFEEAMAAIRADTARGLSPAQIAACRSAQFAVSPSTIYRWIAAGYGGMSNLELRRKVGYKPRKEHIVKPTSHGPEHSFAAFAALSEDTRLGACEMDTVIGRSRDTRCILTLYLRPFKMQLALLLADKTSSAVAAALDMLERAIGKPLFQRLFGLILTDNGTEFSNTEAIERSALEDTTRCEVYYCDVRQSQLESGCERNHVELRMILPKGRGIAFDDLHTRDLAILMSHLNSQPRASLAMSTPISMLKGALKEEADVLLDALGIEEVAYDVLDMTVEAINRERRKRGDKPLI